MKLYYLVWIIFYMKTIDSIVYYSKNPKAYEEAKLACNNTGGRLLRYGQLFNEVVRNCTEDSTRIWTGTPWYIRTFLCYTLYPDNGLSFPSSNTEVAQCADKCDDGQYVYFATQVTECKCFTENISRDGVLTNYCITIACPGNAYEQCGNDKSPDSKQYVLYEKVNNDSLPTFGNICSVRTYLTHASDGKQEYKDCSLNDITFICKVGDTDDIACSYDELMKISTASSGISTDTETTSSPFKSSETTIVIKKDASSSIPTLSTKTMSLKLQSSNTTIFLGMIIGIIVVLVLIVITVLVMIFVLIRFRRELMKLKKKINTDYEVPQPTSIPVYTSLNRGNQSDAEYEISAK